jgi:hypothetical protein
MNALRRGVYWALDRDEKACLAAWLNERIPHGDIVADDNTILGGVWRQGRVRAVVAFTDWLPDVQTMQATIAGEPGWATRGALRAMFAYPFVTAGARLLWATIPADLLEVLEFNQRLGFVEDGRLRERFGHGRAAVLASMTHEEWQRGPYRMEMG